MRPERNDDLAARWRYEGRQEECTVQRDVRYVSIVADSFKGELTAKIRLHTRNSSRIFYGAALDGHGFALSTYRIGQFLEKITSQMTLACLGASCVVSALQGLRDVIVDMQTSLLEAAIKAGVRRFIPSDYSIDFTKLAPGENRNLDLRWEFHKRVDTSSIQATTIFNGALTDMLTGQMPLIRFVLKRVLYWGNAD
jgi:hypothetical protein